MLLIEMRTKCRLYKGKNKSYAGGANTPHIIQGKWTPKAIAPWKRKKRKVDTQGHSTTRKRKKKINGDQEGAYQCPSPVFDYGSCQSSSLESTSGSGERVSILDRVRMKFVRASAQNTYNFDRRSCTRVISWSEQGKGARADFITLILKRHETWFFRPYLLPYHNHKEVQECRERGSRVVSSDQIMD